MNLKSIFRTIATCSLFITVDANAQLYLHLDSDYGVNPWTGEGQSIFPPLSVVSNIEYDILGEVVNIKSKYPVICHRSFDGYSSLSNPHLYLRVLDPNLENKADTVASNHLLAANTNMAINYSAKSINIQSESRDKSVCISDYYYDIIYEDDFDVTSTDPGYIYYEIDPPNSQQGFVPGEWLTYHMVYENNTGMEQKVDFVEYYPKTASGVTHLTGFDLNSLSCVVEPIPGQPVLSGGPSPDCSYDNNNLSKIYVESIPAGYRLVVTYRRQISLSAISSEQLEMMFAIFVKGFTNDPQNLLGTGSIPNFDDFHTNTISIPVVSAQ